MKLFKTLLVLVTTLSVAGCGFHLRGSQTLPQGVEYVALIAASEHSDLVRAVDKRLDLYEIHGGFGLPDSYKKTAIVMQLAPEKLDRRLLSVFSTGQVAEYQLVYTVKYTVTFPDGKHVPATIEVLREYQDDPDQVLAKSRELNLVLDEMRVEAADRMIRLLSSQASTL